MNTDEECFYEDEEFLEIDTEDAGNAAQSSTHGSKESSEQTEPSVPDNFGFTFSLDDHQQAESSQRKKIARLDSNNVVIDRAEPTVFSSLHDDQRNESPQNEESLIANLDNNVDNPNNVPMPEEAGESSNPVLEQAGFTFPVNNHHAESSLDAVDPLGLDTSYNVTANDLFFNVYEHDESSQLFQDNDHPLAASSGKDSLFCFCGTFFQRLYRSQLRPRELFKCDILGNSVQEVHQSLWTAADKEIRREVIFKDEHPNWSDKEKPEINEIDKFLTLHDPRLRKGYSVSALTHRLLTKWRNKTIKVYIYVYSSNVESNAQYQCLLRKLVAPQVPDRAGAHSMQSEAALAKELMEKHPDLEGHHSSWLLWANHINSSPAHKRDQLKSATSPPVEISKHFRWAPVSEAARLQTVHRGMVVARTVNDGWMQKMAEVKKGIDTALTVLNAAKSTIDTMMSAGSYGSELFSALETTTRPEETSLSTTLASQVVDCEDIDHL